MLPLAWPGATEGDLPSADRRGSPQLHGFRHPSAALTILLMRLVLRSRKWKQVTGPEEMIGAEGVVVEPVSSAQDAPEGLIRIHGELWRATSTQPVAEGKSVRVLRIDGLKLYVEPLESTA